MIALKGQKITLLGTAFAVTIALTAAGCGDGQAAGESNLPPLGSAGASDGRPLVPREDVLAGKRSGRLLVLKRTGKLVWRVPSFSAPSMDGVELAPDRRHAFVSVRRSEQPAHLYEVNLATGAKRLVASAISPALSPDRTRLAYVLTEVRVDITYRTALVVRDLGTGQAHAIPLGPDVPYGTPPELVINWSPDGQRVAIYDGARVRLVDVTSARDVVSQPSVGPKYALAPVFLNARKLVVLANCCIGDQHLVAIDLLSGGRKRFAVLRAPVESIKRLRSGRLLTVTALNELVLVSRGRTRMIARAVTAAAG